MKKKPFWIPLLVCIVTTAVLYFIGYRFHIETLRWFQYKETSAGFSFGGSLNPIIIGLIVGVIVDLIIRFIQRGRSNLV